MVQHGVVPEAGVDPISGSAEPDEGVAGFKAEVGTAPRRTGQSSGSSGDHRMD